MLHIAQICQTVLSWWWTFYIGVLYYFSIFTETVWCIYAFSYFCGVTTVIPTCQRCFIVLCGKRLKVSTFIYCHLQGNSDQERFTIRSGELTANDTRWRSSISGSPLPELTDFGPRSLQLVLTDMGQLTIKLNYNYLSIWLRIFKYFSYFEGLGLELVFSDIFPTIALDFYTYAGGPA